MPAEATGNLPFHSPNNDTCLQHLHLHFTSRTTSVRKFHIIRHQKHFSSSTAHSKHHKNTINCKNKNHRVIFSALVISGQFFTEIKNLYYVTKSSIDFPTPGNMFLDQLFRENIEPQKIVSLRCRNMTKRRKRHEVNSLILHISRNCMLIQIKHEYE